MTRLEIEQLRAEAALLRHLGLVEQAARVEREAAGYGPTDYRDDIDRNATK